MIERSWPSTHGRPEVEALLATLLAGDDRQTTPSTYETARLVSLAPWLEGNAARLRYLVAAQQSDGGWGGVDGYALVPTLSATEALLRVLRQRPSADRWALAAAADRGLAALFRWLGGPVRSAVPDTIAVEVLVPWLARQVNDHLDALARDGGTERFARWSAGSARLGLPDGIDDTALTQLQAMAATGRPVPAKLWHSLEFLGSDARAAAGVRATDGVVCGSVAATAAWLGEHPADDRAAARLAAVQACHGGPVPGIYPITVFEHAWVLAALADAGLGVTAPESIVAGLHRACGEEGAPAAIGLPADADDTAAVLYALARVGRPASAECLWTYEADRYFHCFIGERTPSTSTNGHVLDALVAAPGLDPARTLTAAATVSDWLLGEQQQDGCWWDKWHASPYYATYVCASALARYGGPGAAAAVDAALCWVLATQRADGSWGRWQGTDEETSYAIQLLLHAGRGHEAAVARGCAFLLRPEQGADPVPLWHDKDLYAPVNVITANRLAALHLAAACLGAAGPLPVAAHS
ncbi:MAG TPA: prenyltransferase [Pseudonocardiaceae bacterium]